MMLIQPLNVILAQDIERSSKNYIKKQCKRCGTNCTLIPEDCWWLCDNKKCRWVQPVDTNTPLFWNYCNSIINDKGDFCKYPTLMTSEMEGQSHICKKCNWMRILKIRQVWNK